MNFFPVAAVVTIALTTLLALGQTTVNAQAPPPAQPPPRNDTNICTGHPFNGLVPNVADCARHFRCTANGPVNGVCPAGQKFDSINLRCTAEPVQCFTCPPNQAFVDVPMDYNCQQFVRCFVGHAQGRACSEGLLFDPVRKQCNIARQVRCACPRLDNPVRPFFVRQWAECGQYYVCVNGTATPGTCPPPLKFNVVTQQCDHADAVNCNGPNTNGF